MKKDKETQLYFSTKAVVFSVVIGIILVASVFTAATVIERNNGRQAMEEALSFMRQRLIMYDNLVASNETGEQIQLLDKSRELARCLDEETEEERQEFLESYASSQRLTGIVLVNSNLDITNFVSADDGGMSAWQTLLEDANVTSLLDYPQKYYMSRLTDNDNIYDYAAVPLSDGQGFLLCYSTHTDTSSSGGQLAIDTLFSGYNLEMDGLIMITDGDVILSSNDDELKGVDVEDYKLIAYHRQQISDEDIDYIREDGIRYMASSGKCKDYYMYVFFPTSSIYRQRYAMLAYVVVLYVIYLLFAISMRQREMNRADQLKLKFLRQMSHDVRTPINGIRGMVRIGDSFPDDMEKQSECRRKIWDASGYLIDLVSDVLDMGKLESGEILLVDEPFEMREVIGSVIAVLENQAKDNAVTLTVREINITHNSLTGSTVHLRRILSNIITNAIKYNRKDGTVDISCVETDHRMPDGRIIYRITCEDTGIGMSRDFQKHMYEQFTQENAAGELSHHGTGLGLPIVKSLVEKMDGSIDCRSKRGEGTIFTIELPFAIDKNAASEAPTFAIDKNDASTELPVDSTPAPSQAASDTQTASLNGVSVLVVEDNELNMEITEFILEDEGMKVTKAWNGEEAVKLFTDSAPGTYSVILMDMMMSVMDGLTATRNIRALDRPDAKEIPIIAMTANVFEEDVNASKEAGMNAHLAKPIDEKQLKKTIEDLL